MTTSTCIAVAQAISLGSHEPDHVARNARHHARIAIRAADEGAALVVFPELSLSCYGYVTPAEAISMGRSCRARHASRYAAMFRLLAANSCRICRFVIMVVSPF